MGTVLLFKRSGEVKVLQINSVVNTTSTGRFVEELGSHLVDCGHENWIAYGRREYKSKHQLIRIGNASSVLVHGAKSLLLDRHGFASGKSTATFLKKAEALKPDIITLNNLHGYYIHIGLLFEALQAWNIPVVWTLFDCWAFTGHCSFYTKVNCTKWFSQAGCQRCPSTHAYPTSLFLDQSERNYTDKKELFSSLPNLHLVVHSQWLKRAVCKSYLKEHPVYHIFNGINLDIFRVIPQATEQTKIILGVANKWSSRKGLKDMVTLSGMLDSSFQVVLIGLETSQIKALPQGIIGIKQTENQEELALWYNKAFVFVNPTYEDNFPTTNLEALACGTPVITYDTGGGPEALSERTGIVVPPGRIDQLVKAVRTIAHWDRAYTEDLCRMRAETYFDKKQCFQDYLTLFESLKKRETR